MRQRLLRGQFTAPSWDLFVNQLENPETKQMGAPRGMPTTDSPIGGFRAASQMKLAQLQRQPQTVSAGAALVDQAQARLLDHAPA